jgi:hypothetical protein
MKTVVKLISGSRLYGTNTPESDTDYITVVMLPPADIVLGKSQNSQNKNGLDDKKVFDLKTFFMELMDGQTWAIETLFAPPNCLVQCTPLWNLLVLNRHLFISKNVAPFVGFASKQARKYSDKGFRHQTLVAVIKLLVPCDPHTTLDSLRDSLTAFIDGLSPEIKENVGFSKAGDRTCDEFFEVCGAKYQMTQQVKVVLPSLIKAEKEFGARSRQASAVNGKDWKALSHAIRVAAEAEELLLTGKLVLPLMEAPYIRQVKEGLRPQAEVDDILETLIENVDAAKGLSKLPAKPNRDVALKLLSDILILAVVDQDRFGADWLYPVRGVVE